jgi:Protein of unknown function (DUF3455)
METWSVAVNRSRRHLSFACVPLFAAAMAAFPRPAHADRITPPPVPENIQVEAGHKAYFVGHAFGTQNYICLPSSNSPTGFAWTLFGPQANLFNDAGRQVMTHFSSANAEEVDNPVRPVWQHSKDTSAVWGRMVPNGSVAVPGAIPWLLIEVVRDEEGPSGGSKMTVTTFIQRLNTVGGTAPATGCAGYGDIGQRKYVPYEADYFFYKAERSHGKESDEF